MGHARAIPLLSNKDDLLEEPWQTWEGGRSVLVVEASSFPTTLQLQLQGPNGTAISLGSNITANGVASHDLPAGSYRMILTGGTATDVYVRLCRVPYQETVNGFRSRDR